MNLSRALKRQQAESILDALDAWCKARPGRRIIIGQTERGVWKAALDTHLPTSGEDFFDTLGQLATIACFETNETPAEE